MLKHNTIIIYHTFFPLLNRLCSKRPSALRLCALCVLHVPLSLPVQVFQYYICLCPGLLLSLSLNNCSLSFPSSLQFVPMQVSIACTTNGISVSLALSAHAGFTRFALNRSVQFGFMVFTSFLACHHQCNAANRCRRAFVPVST